MRVRYQQQLDELGLMLQFVCDFAVDGMDRSTEALLSSDLLLAERVIGDQEAATRALAAAEQKAFAILARQAPVAKDLRDVVSDLRTIADLDRMVALATHIARLVRRRHPQSAIPSDVADHFGEMGRLVVEIARHTRSALLTQDTETAQQLRHDDAKVNELHGRLFAVLTDHRWSHGVGSAVDVTLLSRYYERFADHAVLIGSRVSYCVAGHAQRTAQKLSAE